MSGVNDDIIAALLLHPGCEECQSLIARVFPGKSAQELVLSQEALKVRSKLNTEMKRIANLFTIHPDENSSSNTIPKIASQYLAGIELRVSEHDGSDQKLDLKSSKTDGAVPSPNAAKQINDSDSMSHHSSTKSRRSLFDPSFIDNAGVIASDNAEDRRLSEEGENEQDNGECVCGVW